MPVTQKDIARELNVSASLVGKVLGGKPNVWASPELCERIRRKAQEMGYRPNGAAQALATGQTSLIAIWAVRLDLHGYASYVQHLQELAHQDGFQVLVRHMEYAPVEWNWPTDGIICIDSPDRIHQYRAAGGTAPIVNLGILGSGDVDEVITDLQAGVVEALQQLAEQRGGRIAYLLPAFATTSLGDGRWQAYRAAMGERTEFIVAAGLDAHSAYEAVRQHVKQHGAPGGLLVFALEMAVGAMRALHDYGARVPEDVAVITSGDSPMLKYYTPSISAIDLPIKEGAAAAWRLLGERRRNPEGPPQRVSLPARIIRRESMP